MAKPEHMTQEEWETSENYHPDGMTLEEYKEYKEVLGVGKARSPSSNSDEGWVMIVATIMLIGFLLLLIFNTKLFFMILLVGFIIISCMAIFSGTSNVVKGVINRNTRYNEYHDD